MSGAVLDFRALHSIVTHPFLSFERQVNSYLHVNMEITRIEFLMLPQDAYILRAPD